MKITAANKLLKESRGNAAIEFALILPLLVVIISGLYDMSKYLAWERATNNMMYDLSTILSRQDVLEGVDQESGVQRTGNERLETLIAAIYSPNKTVTENSTKQNLVISNFLYPTNITSVKASKNNAGDPGIRAMWTYKYSGNHSDSVEFPTTTSAWLSSNKSSIKIDETVLELRRGEGVNFIYFEARYKPLIIPDNALFQTSKLFWTTNNLNSQNYICTDCATTSNSMTAGAGDSLRKNCPRPAGDSGYASTSGCEF